MKNNNAAQEKVNIISVYEQNLQTLFSQKQNFNMQLTELESSELELGKTKKAYSIIGNIMVAKDPSELKKDISKKKEMFEIRLKSIEKQEDKIREKITELQNEVMKEIKSSD